MIARRRDILDGGNWRVKAMTVDGWGALCVRQIAPADNAQLEALGGNKEQGPEFWATVIVASVCDERGRLLLKRRDLRRLVAKPPKLLRALASQIATFQTEGRKEK